MSGLQGGTLVAFGRREGEEANSIDPVALESLEGASIVDVAFGGKHTLCLSVKGEVFAFGLNHEGQLGLDDTVDRLSPTPIKAFALLKMLHNKLIVQVCCVFAFARRVRQWSFNSEFFIVVTKDRRWSRAQRRARRQRYRV
jgi:alpha-tubulin suppressor-like RCC1 family protein